VGAGWLPTARKAQCPNNRWSAGYVGVNLFTRIYEPAEGSTPKQTDQSSLFSPKNLGLGHKEGEESLSESEAPGPHGSV